MVSGTWAAEGRCEEGSAGRGWMGLEDSGALENPILASDERDAAVQASGAGRGHLTRSPTRPVCGLGVQML